MTRLSTFTDQERRRRGLECVADVGFDAQIVCNGGCVGGTEGNWRNFFDRALPAELNQFDQQWPELQARAQRSAEFNANWDADQARRDEAARAFREHQEAELARRLGIRR